MCMVNWLFQLYKTRKNNLKKYRHQNSTTALFCLNAKMLNNHSSLNTVKYFINNLINSTMGLAKPTFDDLVIKYL